VAYFGQIAGNEQYIYTVYITLFLRFDKFSGPSRSDEGSSIGVNFQDIFSLTNSILDAYNFYYIRQAMSVWKV